VIGVVRTRHVPPHRLEVLCAASDERQLTAAGDAPEHPLDRLRMVVGGDVEAGAIARGLENGTALHPNPRLSSCASGEQESDVQRTRLTLHLQGRRVKIRRPKSEARSTGGG
jgi:hypothetical protein